MFVLERLENGDFYGFLQAVHAPAVGRAAASGNLLARFAAALEAVRRQRRDVVEPIVAELGSLSDRLQDVNDALLHLAYRQRHAAAGTAPTVLAAWQSQVARLNAQAAEINRHSQQLVNRQHEAEVALRENVSIWLDGQGQQRTIPLSNVVRYYQPNAMGFAAKVGHYLARIWELLSAAPRESNTEGGLFPAIFGTVMLVFLMAISCFPLGVLAGTYLAQYAKEGLLVRLVRVAVNNLAGVPSIVYGIFGLGFFIYGVGAQIDRLVLSGTRRGGHSHFGTGGILWARHHPGPAHRAGGDRGHRGSPPGDPPRNERKAPWPWGPPRCKPWYAC